MIGIRNNDMKISDFSRIIINGNIFNNIELEPFPNNKKTIRICNIYGKMEQESLQLQKELNRIMGI